jgi:hypothetical protein
MELGATRTRFEGWTRTQALALLAMLAVILAFACWTPATAPSPKQRAASEHSDLRLYRDIIAGVEAGGNYYAVAAQEQRAAGYPLKPFYTFRLPTHAAVYAALGEQVMVLLLWAVAAGLIVGWWIRLEPLLPVPLLGSAMVLLAGGMGGLLQPQTGIFHESWAGLLLALMVALWRPDRAWPAMIAGGAALMLRELALPMILAMGGLALLDRRWREAVGWAALVGLFALYLALHAHWVADVVLPGDLASQGWSRFLGSQFALKSIAQVTFGVRLPGAMAAALLVLSFFGWASVRAPWALRAVILLLGYTLMLALFARRDTFYWALIAAPLSFMGLAFLPAAFTDLAKAMGGKPYANP